MRSELRPVVRAFSARRDPAGGAISRYRAQVNGSDVVAAPIGVGPAAARRATTSLLDELGRAGGAVDHVVVSGIAGGLDPAATVGTVLVPEVVLDLASGRELRAHPLGPRVPAGKVATADEVILDPDRLSALLARGVTALDMETAAVGAVCEDRDVPWTAFRAISDRPDGGLLDASLITMLKEDGTTDAWAAARYIVTHPRRLPALSRLAQDSSRGARRAAAAALEAVSGG